MDPNHAYLGLLLGLLLIYRECLRPGSIVPGVGGGVLVVVCLFGLSRFPVTAGGLAHIIIGAGLLVLQGFRTWAWLPGIAGASTLAIGAHHLMAAPPYIDPIYAAMALPFSAATVYLLRIAVRARRNKLKAD